MVYSVGMATTNTTETPATDDREVICSGHLDTTLRLYPERPASWYADSFDNYADEDDR